MLCGAGRLFTLWLLPRALEAFNSGREKGSGPDPGHHGHPAWGHAWPGLIQHPGAHSPQCLPQIHLPRMGCPEPARCRGGSTRSRAAAPCIVASPADERRDGTVPWWHSTVVAQPTPSGVTAIPPGDSAPSRGCHRHSTCDSSPRGTKQRVGKAPSGEGKQKGRETRGRLAGRVGGGLLWHRDRAVPRFPFSAPLAAVGTEMVSPSLKGSRGEQR